ncbi:hypothetical protein DEU56DRAFT_915158 [Suillus clintonianus]|uniref:uncharacterized protein n=1 Tax=Suillus clintonianus TaxID=1904413 RepID=UPI001B87F1B7|nr:uncharacterized protein DEU56DRAFT_915158 [Suillus clintonianus]KAG2129440.1 hypothetical protein DEU56DRAFT_915158 [Suillus clintonianus]
MSPSSDTGSGRPARNERGAKKNAMENAVWMTTKAQCQRHAADKPTVTKKTFVQGKTHVSDAKHGRCDSSRTPDSEIPGLAPRKRQVVETSKGEAHTKKRRVAEPHADSDVDMDVNDDEGRMSAVKHTQMKGKEKELRSSSNSQQTTRNQIINDGFLSDEHIDGISDFQPSHNDSESEKDSDEEEIEDDSEEPKSLSAKTPVFVSGSKAKQPGLPLTQPTCPRTTTSKERTRTAEPFPFSSAQPRATKKTKSQSARNQKRANETPVWADVPAIVSDGERGTAFSSAQPRATKKTKSQSARDQKRANETPDWADAPAVTSDEEHEAAMVSDHHSDAEEDDSDGHADRSGRPTLIWTDTGKLKLTDQDIDTRRVVQRAILEAKLHMTFANGYPELTEKSLFTRDALLTAARACGVPPIQDRLKTDDSYVTALATLIEARVPLFHTELKDDACAQVTSYYHLGPDCVDTAKALLVNHVYHYEQHFSEKNDPIPQPKKPYFADILPYLMKGRYFNGPKSVGVKFSDRFKKIARNKAERPEVTIPMVALTSTSVYAALFWKANGSPSKFNFMGNLFSEVYFFHVRFLEDMKVTAPHKFHKMMADIFEAVQKLCTHGNIALVGSHESAMAFLDIAGMDDEE